uniref:T-box domain-containing protein n=1 Tax=Amphimedon queenslandica TaxID=400682 RepID=A0A1X7UNF7_AMPQE
MNTEVAPEEFEPEIKRGCWKEEPEDDELPLLNVPDNSRLGGVKMETADPSISLEICSKGGGSLLGQEELNPQSTTSTDSPEAEELEESPSPLLATPHSGITLTLDNMDLWSKFSAVATEMIITKSGRRMFPTFSASICGLQMDQKYTMTFRCNPADNKRYKFVNTSWVVAGKGESHIDDLLAHVHPDSPALGKHWLHNKVHFKKVKLTNNKNTRKGQIALNSMHKYIPCVIVSKFITRKKSEVVHVQEFPEAYFYAVTAYQNDQVTQLKIDNNPFAKAFRDSPADSELQSGFNYHGNWFNNGISRWPVPSSPLLGPSSYPQNSPLLSPKWPPLSPLLSPYQGDFTQVTFSQVTPSAMPITGPSPLPQFGSVFGWDSSTGHFSLATSNMFRPSLPTTPTIPTLPPTTGGANIADAAHDV